MSEKLSQKLLLAKTGAKLIELFCLEKYIKNSALPTYLKEKFSQNLNLYSPRTIGNLNKEIDLTLGIHRIVPAQNFLDLEKSLTLIILESLEKNKEYSIDTFPAYLKETIELPEIKLEQAFSKSQISNPSSFANFLILNISAKANNAYEINCKELCSNKGVVGLLLDTNSGKIKNSIDYEKLDLQEKYFGYLEKADLITTHTHKEDEREAKEEENLKQNMITLSKYFATKRAVEKAREEDSDTIEEDDVINNIESPIIDTTKNAEK